MHVIKSGTVNTVQRRTGIKEGDSVCVYLPLKIGGKRLLFSVSRYHNDKPHNELRFEGGDNKAMIEGYEPTESGAYQFMMLISQITGLQAQFAHKKAGSYITFIMQKGKGLLLHERDISK